MFDTVRAIAKRYKVSESTVRTKAHLLTAHDSNVGATKYSRESVERVFGSAAKETTNSVIASLQREIARLTRVIESHNANKP